MGHTMFMWIVVLSIVGVLLAWGMATADYEDVSETGVSTSTTSKPRVRVNSYCDRVTGDCVEPDFDYGE